MALAGFEQPKRTLVMPKLKRTGKAGGHVAAAGGPSPANNASRSAGNSPSSPQDKPKGKAINKKVGLIKGAMTNNGYQTFKSYKGGV